MRAAQIRRMERNGGMWDLYWASSSGMEEAGSDCTGLEHREELGTQSTHADPSLIEPICSY